MISVIIVNYNKKDLLKKCLDSVRGQDFQDIEIIVVDNASTDGSVELVNVYYPEARLIRNRENLLFCKAQNQGIEASKGAFVLCLNNDAVLCKDYLSEALYSIGLDERIGMVSGKILRMDKKTIDSAGLFLGRNRKPVERGYNKSDKGQYDKAGYIFGVSGAACFLRKAMLDDIKDGNGYFDERFGMYYEDLDICWRARKKAWKAYYNPKAIAYHVRSGTAAGPKDRKSSILPYLSEGLRKRYIMNRYLCMRKNDTLMGLLPDLPFILFYDIKIWLYILLTKLKVL